MLLKALDVTRIPLPCLVAADKAMRAAPRDREAIVLRYLKALTKAANDGLERLKAIEGDRIRGTQAITVAHWPGNLIALAALLQRRPLLTPLFVSPTLRLTISGAGKLLTRAACAGLVVEVSGRQAWRAYLTPHLAVLFGFTARSAGRPPALPPADAHALARFDAEMAKMDAVLVGLGVVIQTGE